MIHRILTAFGLGLTALALTAGEPVRAEWYEASSDRFVIYAEASEEDVRRYAENLERFHAAMEHFTGRTLPKPSPSNRITLFAAGSTGAVGELVINTMESFEDSYEVVDGQPAPRVFDLDHDEVGRGRHPD